MTKENLEAADNELSSSNVDDVPERPNFEYYKPFGATALGSSVTPKTPTVRPLVDPNLPPEIGQFLEKYADPETAEEEFSTFETITGYGAGMATEVGTFVTLTSALAKWNKASMMGPGALRNLTPVGLGTTAFIEGLSAYGANYAQQMYLKAYGLDKSENINAGELVASTLLGPSQVAERVEEGVTGAFKYILKNESFDKLKAWKGGQFLTKEGTGRFITGASLGLAESAIRQEIESLLNGTERNVYDYLISAGAGGGMQYSLFKLWGETGKWGRDQAAAAFGKSRKRLEDRKSELLQELKESQQTGNKYKKKGASIRITKEIEKVEQAQSVVDEAFEAVVKANDAATKREQELSKDVDPIEEPEVEAPKEVAPVITPDKPEQPILPPLNVDEPQPITTTDAPQKRDRFVDDVREDKLDELESRIQNIGVTPEGGTLPTEGPKVHRDGKKLADETALKVEGLVRVLAKNTEDIDKNVAQELLKEIKFTRRLNKNVIDWFNTTGARLLQSQKKDAQIYEWEGRYSERAQLQDEALSRLEATLEAKTRGLIDGDEADIQKMFDDYLAIPDQLKARYKKPVETAEDEFVEVFKEPKITEEADVETKPTKEVKQNLGKQKKKLQEKLTELQKRFGDRSKLILAETGEELPEDVDIADLKRRIKFYEQAESDALELEKLEAELAKVAKLDTAPLGEQRAAVTPKPTGPKKVNIKAAQLRKRIAVVKSNIKKRLADIDRARLEMTEEFQVAKAEGAVNNRLSKLQSELDELRETFGREPEELVPGKPKEKDPRVKELEDKIKFYKEAQNDIKKIKDLEAERARLLEIETGTLGRQREEITPKPTGPKKAPGRVEELNKDIAFLRKNMRNRVREIDRARVEMSDEFKAEQLRKAYENKRTKLEKELKQLRNRFAAIDKEEAAAGLKPKKRKKDPRLKELEEKVKFYKEAEKEVKLVADLEAELARVADIEGRSIIGEVRAEITPAPKGPTKPLKSQILKKKIAESKTRMRQKIADLDRARKEIEDAQLTARLFKEIEESFHKQLETDVSSMITRGWRWVQSMRQQSLINQLPSAMAGIPTGVGGIVKQFFRPVGNFIYNKDNVALPVRTRLALADAAGALRTIHLTKDLWVEARRTFAENASAIDRRAGRLSDEMSISAAPRGTHAVVSRAYTSAKRRAEAIENVSNAFTRFFKYGDIFKVMSLGVRGIQSVDSVFKRMLKRGRQHSLAQKKAILEFPDDPAKAQQRALEIYKAQWRDSDGLDVLNDTTDFDFEMSQIDEELLFAADGDLADMPVDPVENFIKRAKDQVNDGGWLGASIDAFAVYIGVPIRSIYRGGKYTLKPAQLVAQGSLAKVPGLRGQINPFSKKVKEFELLIRGEYEILRRTDDPEKIKGARDRIEGLTERRNLAAERRLKYNEELITDAMVASSLMMVGGATALYYGGTGSLEWLTPEQRKNNKLESFKMFGSDYSAAMPWAFPLALSADVASWFRIKAEERATGKTILTKEQTLSYVIGSSFKKLAEAMPLAQGIETAQDIAAFEGDVTKNAISRLLASYIPIPAQLRKINNTINQEGIPDLRGGSYWERVAYSVVGSGVTNLKTDRLGEDEQNTANWITQNIIRQAPKDELIRTEFDKVVATDTHGNLSNKPSMLATGIKMTEWVNEDGMTLSYAFDQKLKKKVLPVTQLKGYRYTIKQAVGALIKDADWVIKYNKGFQIDPESGRFVNEGLAELNTVMNKFYNETKKDILKDDQFTNTFVNEDDESLYYLLRTRGLKPEAGGRPLSPLEILMPKQ